MDRTHDICTADCSSTHTHAHTHASRTSASARLNVSYHSIFLTPFYLATARILFASQLAGPITHFDLSLLIGWKNITLGWYMVFDQNLILNLSEIPDLLITIPLGQISGTQLTVPRECIETLPFPYSTGVQGAGFALWGAARFAQWSELVSWHVGMK
jgi:hypothetical protein